MEKQSPNDIWYKLILNPGQAGKVDEETGLDARLLENMIENGVIPKDILEHEIELDLNEMRLHGQLKSALPDDRISIFLTGKPNPVKIKTPIWIPWLCRRAAKENNQSAHQAIELMHKLDLVPWGKKVLRGVEKDIYGLDVVFPMCWESKYVFRDGGNTILDLALSETPEEDMAVLRGRIVKHCQRWEASAKRSGNVEQFKVMAKHGLWSPDVEAGLTNDTFETFYEKGLVEVAFAEGANQMMAKAQVGSIKETMEVKREILEEMDRTHDRNMGRKSRSSGMDKLVNGLLAGSSSIDGNVLIRAISKGKAAHRDGMGAGLALLLAVGKSKDNAQRMVEALETKGREGPDWEKWLAQEAMGMEGTGVLEGDCLMAAKISAMSSIEDVTKAEQFDSLLRKFENQNLVELNWGKIIENLEATGLWKSWAMNTTLEEGEISQWRARLGHSEKDTQNFENLVGQTQNLELDVYTHDNMAMSQRLMVAHGNMLRAMASEDWEQADIWASRALEKWATILITTCLDETWSSTNDGWGWSGKSPGAGIEYSLIEFDPIEAMRDIPNCQRTRETQNRLMSYLDRPLRVSETGYVAARYHMKKGSKKEISPMEYIGRDTQRDPPKAKDASEQAKTMLKRFYLMSRHWMKTLDVARGDSREAGRQIKM